MKPEFTDGTLPSFGSPSQVNLLSECKNRFLFRGSNILFFTPRGQKKILFF